MSSLDTESTTWLLAVRDSAKLDSVLSRTVITLTPCSPGQCLAWLRAVPDSAKLDSLLSQTVLSLNPCCPSFDGLYHFISFLRIFSASGPDFFYDLTRGFFISNFMDLYCIILAMLISHSRPILNTFSIIETVNICKEKTPGKCAKCKRRKCRKIVAKT